MGETFNRAMLEVARAARGITQNELAARASVTQALISKIENGITTDPTPETVAAIAGALNLPQSYFYSDERPHGLPAFHYRKRAKLGKKALDRIEADINLRRIHISRLLRSFEFSPERSIPVVDLERMQWTPAMAAQHLRQLWLMPRGPVDHLTYMLEQAGAIVVHVDFDTAMLDALSFRLPGLPPLVFMNKNVPGERYRFTLAHELAHLVLHNQPETDETMEEQADEFASEFLLPAKEVRPYLSYPSISKLARIKPYWKVSIKALIVRCMKLKMITPNQYTGLNVNYSKSGYSRGEPYPVEIERPSVLSQAVQYHLNQLAYSYEDLAKLLMMTPDEMAQTYTEGPRLRLIK
ncbi:helix-turn-helix domain-containing protein [Aestuariivirga sp.]|uniref:helix-turn-helix domain-containing protein n=1 Tax=Aestuariivirga sp. TaxID=2650926 RepID=UPI003BABB10C